MKIFEDSSNPLRITGMRPKLENNYIHIVVSDETLKRFYYVRINMSSNEQSVKLEPIHNAKIIFSSKWIPDQLNHYATCFSVGMEEDNNGMLRGILMPAINPSLKAAYSCVDYIEENELTLNLSHDGTTGGRITIDYTSVLITDVLNDFCGAPSVVSFIPMHSWNMAGDDFYEDENCNPVTGEYFLSF